jgi:protease-4
MKEYFVWLSKLVTLVILFVIIIPVLIGVLAGTSAILSSSSGISKTAQLNINDKSKNVAVVELVGEIMDTKEVVQQLYDYSLDESVHAIVLRVDSPGGQVAPSQDIYRAITKIKQFKPVVTAMGSMAASGGFYAGIASTKVVAQPGTMAGSIGVIMQIPNVEKIASTVGVNMLTIRSGNLKDVGNMFRPMLDEEKQYLENVTNLVHSQFITDISLARKMPIEKVKEFADGRIILGSTAKELGLVDEFGDLDDAARLALSLAGKNLTEKESPNLIYHEDKFKDLKKFLNAASTLPTKLLGLETNVPVLKYQVF